jgi:hypothetical protein
MTAVVVSSIRLTQIWVIRAVQTKKASPGFPEEASFRLPDLPRKPAPLPRSGPPARRYGW